MGNDEITPRSCANQRPHRRGNTSSHRESPVTGDCMFRPSAEYGETNTVSAGRVCVVRCGACPRCRTTRRNHRSSDAVTHVQAQEGPTAACCNGEGACHPSGLPMTPASARKVASRLRRGPHVMAYWGCDGVLPWIATRKRVVVCIGRFRTRPHRLWACTLRQGTACQRRNDCKPNAPTWRKRDARCVRPCHCRLQSPVVLVVRTPGRFSNPWGFASSRRVSTRGAADRIDKVGVTPFATGERGSWRDAFTSRPDHMMRELPAEPGFRTQVQDMVRTRRERGADGVGRRAARQMGELLRLDVLHHVLHLQAARH